MIIELKNKNTLIVDQFKFRCCIGKNGLTRDKKEGDLKTPKGTYKLGILYYRNDRNPICDTKLTIKKITKNMGWCNDPKNKHYNKEIKIKKSIRHEKLFRVDYKYNYLIVIEYNTKKITAFKGSAIFIHLTKDYKPTAGCIALKENDFLTLSKLISKNTKIKIA
jgi:L,D-peptidoglycan transpeptidase YkuD (ErfK/YbiS/YcfS/YnhG family)